MRLKIKQFFTVFLFFLAAIANTKAEDKLENKTNKVKRTAKALAAIQVTATRNAETVIEVPVATTVVSRDQIRTGAPQTVMDALHGNPGTFVQQTTPGQGVVIIRGLKGSEVLHLVDGFRLNNGIFRNAPNQYVALVDSQILDRIEVVRGPMSVLYGGDAMGGVVQMLTWDPKFNGHEWQTQAGLRSSWTSADRAMLSHAEAAIGHESLVISGGLTYQDVNKLRVGGGARLPYTDFIARGGNLKVMAIPSEGHEFMLQAQFHEQPSTPRFDELVPGFGQGMPTSSVFQFEPQQRRLLHARYRAYIPDAFFENIELHLGRQLIRDDRRNRDFGSNNQDYERNEDTTDGVSLLFAKTLPYSHDLSLGFDWYRDQVRSSRLREQIITGSVSSRPSRFPDGSSQLQKGLFITDDWKLTPTLDVLSGLRYSLVSVSLPPVINNTGVSTRQRDVSGNLGLNWKLREGLHWVTNLGTGFRAANIFDLGTFGTRPGNRFNIPNSDLEPERIKTIDAGLKLDLPNLTGELIAFRSHYQDKITSVLTGERTSSGQLIVQSRNVTSQNIHGIEAGLRWYPTERLQAYGTSTWTRGNEKIAMDEYPADRIPPVYGKFGLQWKLGKEVMLESYVFYAGRQSRLSPRDVIDPRIDPAGTRGWFTLNGRLTWQANRQWGFSLGLENITDRRYREHGTGLDEPGRNLMLTADWHVD
jgi:outer membrane receptor protein involved in Fe transport